MQTYKQFVRQTDRDTDRQGDRDRDSKTDRERADSQIGRLANLQTVGFAGRQAD